MCLYRGNSVPPLKTRLHSPHGASSSAADTLDCWRLNLQPVVFADKRSKEAFWKRSAQIWSVTVVNHQVFILCYWTFNHISEMNYDTCFLFLYSCMISRFLFFVYIFFFFLHLCSFFYHPLVCTDFLQRFSPHHSCVTSEVSKVQYVVFLFWTDHNHHWLV